MCMLSASLAQVSLLADVPAATCDCIDEGWEFQLGDFPLTFLKVGIGEGGLPGQPGGNNNGIPDVIGGTNGWRRVDLPHDWAVELPFAEKGSKRGYHAVGRGFPANSVGWYRRRVDIPSSAEGGRVFVRFDGVVRDSMYWMNGCYLGRNESGYIGRRFDVTDVVDYGSGDNWIVVRCDATVEEGWWYEGAGIYRHVWLECKPADGLVPDSVRIALRDLSADRAVMHVDYETFREGRGSCEFTLEKPRLWSLDDPYLYTLDLKGERFRYGVRTVEFDSERGLLLNGKPVFVKGVCCHQDHAGVGVAVPDAIQEYRIRRLKSMGVNAYRTSHHAPTPELLDVCDRLGVLVMDETRLFSPSEEGLGQFSRLVRRDRNHPCVVAWSIGNEEHNVQDTKAGRRIAEAFRRVQRELDPTRVVTYGGNNGMIHEGVNEVVDVRGVNYIRLLGDDAALDEYHHRHPGVPVWGSEEASTMCTRGGEAYCDGKQEMADLDCAANRPYHWALAAEEWCDAYARHPWLAGAFAWSGFDYRGECAWPAVNCNFGIMDLCGYPKNNYHYYRARWTDDDVLQVYPHLNLPRTNLWVNTNCDEVELVVNGRSCGRIRRPPGKYRLSFPVDFTRGTVLARGVRDGRAVEFSASTAGPLAMLRMTPDRKRLVSDGRDATVVDVVALDECGREVPDCCEMVSVRLSGEGRILGVGNGNPVSHEPDKCPEGAWRRRLFNGRMQIVVQSGLEPGEMSIEASAPGDPAARTVVSTERRCR